MRELTRVFNALSDETRLRMLKLLSERELCVCEIMQAMGISQTRASRNLGILRDAGLLVDRREGQWVHYSLSEHALSSFSKLIELVEDSLVSDEIILKDKKKLEETLMMEKHEGRKE